MPALVIGAASSGSGKTTVTMGLLSALGKRGLAVQPYKVGPDYIDPAFHSWVTGRPSRNLDAWMTGEAGVRDSFARGAAGADIGLIEGVMGLFDGRQGSVMEGSTAHIAATLGVPVIMVLDVGKISGSAAAVVSGFASLRPEVRIAGIVLNNVGSARHRRYVEEAIAAEARIAVLGALPRNQRLTMPSRHLGLVPAAEQSDLADTVEAAAMAVEEHIDLDALIGIANTSQTAGHAFSATAPGIHHAAPGADAAPVRIGVARDAAFSFYYRENLERLQEAGAELLLFSPMKDASLPAGISGLIFGGGFPEMFATELSSNRSLIKEIGEAATSGMPVYAECGGLIYLSRRLRSESGSSHDLAGIIPAEARMRERRKVLGYQLAKGVVDLPIGPAETVFRGHEFHYSEVEWADGPRRPAFSMSDESGGSREDGFAAGGTLASYLHLHFGSDAAIAPRFVESCRSWGREGR